MTRRIGPIITRNGRLLFGLSFSAQLLIVSWSLFGYLQDSPERWGRILLLWCIMEFVIGVILWRAFVRPSARIVVGLVSTLLWTQGLYYGVKGLSTGDLDIAFSGTGLFLIGIAAVAADIYWTRRRYPNDPHRQSY